MDIETELSKFAKNIDVSLNQYLDGCTLAPEALIEATRYSLLAGGKRLRPFLLIEAAALVGGEATMSKALLGACALEMIHTYSLVHDDLPAMDDDDLRRGKPTLHKVYDEATAILVGDGLLTMAFEVAAQTGNIKVIREISQAAGVGGMVGGQYIDLRSEGETLELDALQHMHHCKTGALIMLSLRCGALLAEADEATLNALTEYGRNLGLAFQITDDILDVTGDEQALGKPVGSDEANQKSTYPALLGLEKARALAGTVTKGAIDALKDFGDEADMLRSLAYYVLERDH